jgi:ferric-dicitrate binding protein FerR (iron transport regulator)
MRRGKLVPLGILAALACTAIALPPAPVGKVTRVFRKADLLRGKAANELVENGDVAENDRIRTQTSGRARVVLNDGSILSIGQSSMLTVKAATDASRAGSLELAYGKIRAVVTANVAGARNYEVRTATAVCGVLGTTLFIDATRNVTRVANLSDDQTSRVRVVSTSARAAGEVILLPGQGTSVPANRAPQPPRRWSPEEVAAANASTDIP